MSKQLNINSPCHESWEKMSENEKGKFCHSCQKVVIDFTQMTDDEVINFLNTLKSNKNCGRFSISQIKNINQKLSTETKTSNVPLWNKVIYTMIGFSLSSPIFAQTPSNKDYCDPFEYSKNVFNDESNLEAYIVDDVDIDKIVYDVAYPKWFLKGIIKGASDLEPLPGVFIQIKEDNKKIVTTNIDGYFSLDLSKERFENNPVTLQIRFIGYFTKEYIIDFNSDNLGEIILLEEFILGEFDNVVIVKHKFLGKLRSKIKNLYYQTFRRKNSKSC
jgi:hypothetical protein